MNKLLPTDSPDMEQEIRLSGLGHTLIAGIDEAGRGPLAGPVVAAAVILDKYTLPAGLDDSKRLSSQRREQLYVEILQSSRVAVSTVAAQTIDQINIRQATLISMERAAGALDIRAHWHLIDGRDVPPGLRGRATAIIKGDRRSMSIAAASIVAKVVRDHIMIEAANAYGKYGFEQHKGYGTVVHRAAIAKYGPCPIHRMSFAPLNIATWK